MSHETYLFLRREVESLRAEVFQLTVDRDRWYMAANYSPEEIAEFARRRSMGLDPMTGDWLTIAEQDAQP